MSELSSQTENLTPENRRLLADAVAEKLAADFHDNSYSEGLRQYATEYIMNGNQQQAAAASEIMLAGTLHGNEVPQIFGRHSFTDAYDKTQQLIGIAVNEPELAHTIVANNVGGFHASNSSSLLGVLEHGILSSREARDRGIALGSGERTYTDHKKRPFISFADWREPRELAQYAVHGIEYPLAKEMLEQQIVDARAAANEWEEQFGDSHPFVVNGRLIAEDTVRLVQELEESPDSLRARLVTANFPVVYGIDVSSYDQVRSSINVKDSAAEKLIAACMARSHVRSEFAVVGNMVPPEDIPVIAVPSARVEMVRDLVRESGRGIDVYPMEPLLEAHGKPKPYG